MNKQELYQSLPNIDEVMKASEVQDLLLEGVAKSVILDAVRRTLDETRAGIKSGQILEPYSTSACMRDALPYIAALLQPSLKSLVNASGIVVHTNLGRSVLPKAAQHAVVAINEGYCNLEYGVETGKRGSRHDHVEALICELTGAEAAMVVNNNAAAVLLTLAGLAGEGETIVSRGQLVEIGGSFRIPDVMEASGTSMLEVGTTNRTHLKDYQEAVDEIKESYRPDYVGELIEAVTSAMELENLEGTGDFDTHANRVDIDLTGASTELIDDDYSDMPPLLLFKAHTSNYRVSGFTKEVSLSELVKLGQETGCLVAEDLGSGVLLDLAKLSGGILPYEPTVQESVATGADIISFSGDKLLGGPQAGIICGKREAISTLKKHPLARALRLDKMTLAALEATLAIYRDLDQALLEIPTLRMLLMSENECKKAAEDLAEALREIYLRFDQLECESLSANEAVSVVADASFAGGGSLPDVELPSYAVALKLPGLSALALEERMRRGGEIPIIGRIKDERFLLGVRTLDAEDIAVILAEFEMLLQ